MNRTFLGIDSILYPETATQRPAFDSAKGGRRKTVKVDTTVSSLAGLKGYPASGKLIYAIMNN